MLTADADELAELDAFASTGRWHVFGRARAAVEVRGGRDAQGGQLEVAGQRTAGSGPPGLPMEWDELDDPTLRPDLR